MKKKIIVIVIIILALMLLFPIPFRLKDGGSIEFRALLYTITKYHKLAPIDENTESGYIDGIGIEILGMEIYNSTNKHDTKVDGTEQVSSDYTDNFELIFNEREDLDTKTIISENETDKYSYNIYSYGGDVKIKINNIEYDLREALLNNKITMEEIISKANTDLDNKVIEGDMYLDGGSMEYRYKNYTILKYHNLGGNRDVYIGVPDMTMNNVE